MAKKTWQERLFGTQTMVPIEVDNTDPQVAEFLNTLDKQPYMQGLLNQPKETGLTLDQYKEGFKQGFNFGVPQLAEKHKEFNINTPKTPEEIELAKIGQFNTDNGLRGGLMAGPRTGGFLNDFQEGYRENYDNKFNVDNLMPQKKGFATRLGEGLGSVGRFIDSPLGRGLIAYGLNSALGYDNSLQEGLTAYVGRQNAQTADRAYRAQLKQMGFDPVEIDSIRGNVTGDMYKNIVNNMYKFRNLDQNTYVKMKTFYDRQLQQGILTPEEYTANVEALNQQYVASQIQTMNVGNVQASDSTKLLPYKQYAMQVAPQVALGNLGVAQGNLGIRQQMLPYEIAYKEAQLDNMLNPDKKLTASQKDAQSTLSQIGTIRQLVKANPNATGLQKGYVPGDIINRLDSNENNIKTRTAIDALRTKVRHDLTGAQFSPKEAREYERFLPTNKDNAQIINAKLDALEQRYYSDFGVSLYDTPQTGGVQTIGKYKVRVK